MFDGRFKGVTQGQDVYSLAISFGCSPIVPPAFALVGKFYGSVIIPNPVLVFSGQEHFTANGKQWTRYNYFVENSSAFPDELFAAAQSPPLWFQHPSLAHLCRFLWRHRKKTQRILRTRQTYRPEQDMLALEQDVFPPSYVYIELNDRQTNRKYKSNLADSAL